VSDHRSPVASLVSAGMDDATLHTYARGD